MILPEEVCKCKPPSCRPSKTPPWYWVGAGDKTIPFHFCCFFHVEDRGQLEGLTLAPQFSSQLREGESLVLWSSLEDDTDSPRLPAALPFWWEQSVCGEGVLCSSRSQHLQSSSGHCDLPSKVPICEQLTNRELSWLPY